MENAMTEEGLRCICKDSDLYRTPELNDVLYCNFKGFSCIGGLERYTALKALFLEGNSLRCLTGIPCCNLTCLYVQGNRIHDLAALNQLPQLKTLNVSNNDVSSIDGIEACRELSTLVCSDNKLVDHKSIAALRLLEKLSTLDIQDNQLEDVEVMELLTGLSTLCSLYAKGNPFLDNVKGYRKSLIAKLPHLSYLDDRPVFALERCGATAWLNAGPEGEEKAREEFLEEKRRIEQENMACLQAMRAQSFRKRREDYGLPSGDTDPFYDTLGAEPSNDISGCSDSQDPAVASGCIDPPGETKGAAGSQSDEAGEISVTPCISTDGDNSGKIFLAG